MSANMENSAVATGLDKVSFHSNPKETQWKRMLKLLHNCTHLSANKVMFKMLQVRLPTVHEPRTSRCSRWIWKRKRNQKSNCQHPLDHKKSKRVPEKNIYFCFINYAKDFDCVDHNKLWKILQEMGIPDHLTCLLRNLYAGQEATVRTGHGTTDGSK